MICVFFYIFGYIFIFLEVNLFLEAAKYTSEFFFFLKLLHLNLCLGSKKRFFVSGLRRFLLEQSNVKHGLW
jgi:hypothetical protein